MNLNHDTLAALYRAYLQARYLWGMNGHWQPVCIGAPTPELEAALPGADCFAMISAWNPLSQPRPEAVNRAADDRLADAIRASGREGVPGFASAPNRTWREPNWVIPGIAPAELDTLAREFGQLGTLYWKRGQPVRLRMDAARPPGIEPHPHVDWIQ